MDALLAATARTAADNAGGYTAGVIADLLDHIAHTEAQLHTARTERNNAQQALGHARAAVRRLGGNPDTTTGLDERDLNSTADRIDALLHTNPWYADES